jgi:arylformamidase
MSWIDITRTLSPETAVWPGDQPVEWIWSARQDEGDAVNLGAIHTTVHAGTHADAPLHTERSGKAIHDVDLNPYVGPAEVIHVRGDTVTETDVSDVTEHRVLFRTQASDLSDTEWPERVTPISQGAIETMNDRGVILVGTDAPSVDPLDSKTLDAHHALFAAGMLNLEGLYLRDVEPGKYSLIALPLKIHGADGSPVRAVLHSNGQISDRR